MEGSSIHELPVWAGVLTGVGCVKPEEVDKCAPRSTSLPMVAIVILLTCA